MASENNENNSMIMQYISKHFVDHNNYNDDDDDGNKYYYRHNHLNFQLLWLLIDKINKAFIYMFYIYSSILKIFNLIHILNPFFFFFYLFF